MQMWQSHTEFQSNHVANSKRNVSDVCDVRLVVLIVYQVGKSHVVMSTVTRSLARLSFRCPFKTSVSL